MLGIDPKAARITWTTAVTLLLLAAVYAIRRTLVVFAIALLFAYLLHPLVDHISRRFPPKNRTPALALTWLTVMGLLAALGTVIGFRVVAEARQLILHPPSVRGFLDVLRIAHPALSPMIGAAQGRLHQQISEIVSAAPQISLSVLAASANLIDLIVIPILSFFILKDGRSILYAFLAMLHGGSSRAGAQRTLAEVHVLLLQYMRSLLILCGVAFTVFSIALTAMGVSYALLLSSIAFLCEFIPLVGPITETVAILAVSALTGYPHMWWLAAFLGAFRLVQDYGIWPRLMSRGIELHPLWVIFGVLAGGQIGGVAGIFLSVPVLALSRLLLIPLFDSNGHGSEQVGPEPACAASA